MREEPKLPPSYTLERDPDLLVLRRPNGSMVAAFSAFGVDPREIEREAWEDDRREGGAPE